jgi:hypothetical protein
MTAERGEDPLIQSAWRVVNIYAYDEDEGDVDMDALGEAITALHAALEMADG